MAITLTNPEALPKVDFHRQVAIATGSKLVFMAGQVAWDADGALVGKGDLAAQVEQCYLNVAAAVGEAGGTFDNVAKLTIYIARWTVDKMPLVQEGRAGACAETRGHPARPRHTHRRRRTVHARPPRRDRGHRRHRLICLVRLPD